MGIGDELMAAGRAARLSRVTGNLKVSINDIHHQRRAHWVWERCPWVARGAEDAKNSIVDGPGARPYIASKTSTHWRWAEYQPDPCPVVLTENEREWARGWAKCFVLAPHLKAAASPNKQWPWHRWQQLARDLARLNMGRVVQLKESYALPALDGALPLVATLWQVAAILETCNIAIVHEGALHHLSAGVRGRAVVIAGGYIGQQNTGYRAADHLWIQAPDPCGARARCKHCENAMNAITTEHVVAAARELSVVKPRALS